jgi:xanthine dehydrogenase YagS FAD-binding subunit
MSSNFSYVRVDSLAQAVRHLADDGARLHAGGTDLLGCLRDEVFAADKLVSISEVEALKGISETASGGLRIGALATISEVAANKQIQKHYAALAQAAAVVASPQLRNQGTIGGTICQKPRCWYYRGEFPCLRKGGDMCYALEGQNQYHCIFGGDLCCIVHPSDCATALTALEATIRCEGPGGRREVPAEGFFIGPELDVQRETVLEPGEVVTEIILPPPPGGLRSSYRKVRARQAWDFALAGVALALQFQGRSVSRARVVLSGAAPVPWRSLPAEEAIIGRRLDDATIVSAAAAAVADAEPLEHNEYKIPLFRGLITEELTTIR